MPIQRETLANAHRERILTAASDVFLANGYERTSTAEIARAARVSKREVYHYFSDKRALLAAVILELQHEMHARMSSTFTSGEDMKTVLLKSAKSIRRFILSERFGKLLRIVVAEFYHSPQIAQQFFELGPVAGQKDTARYLAEQMKAGLLRKASAKQAAYDYLNLVIGAQTMTAVVLGQKLPEVALTKTEHAVEVFLQTYAPVAEQAASQKTRLLQSM